MDSKKILPLNKNENKSTRDLLINIDLVGAFHCPI
jgi:hypothetical protein